MTITLPDALTATLQDVRTLMVICNQWGDSGKGKFSDYFSAWADVIARGTGGANAGHTVVINGKKRIYHLLPAGIAHDGEGKTTILGNGMVLDLELLVREMDAVANDGIRCDHLMVSEDAHVTLPYHVQEDQKKDVSQANGGVGSTGRGIGPTYADKIARRGIVVRDLYNPDLLEKKIRERLIHHEALRRGTFVQELLEKTTVSVLDVVERLESLDIIISDDEKRELFQKDVKGLTAFYGEIAAKDVDIEGEVKRTMEYLKPFADRIRPHVRDTIAEMHLLVAERKKILAEGAQGLLLSSEFGTYPYGTSSDCSANGTAAGVGLSAKAFDRVYCIVKFPITTRVGAGPFPCEFGGRESERYCAAGLAHDIRYELTTYGIPFKEENGDIHYDHHHPAIVGLMNDGNPFLQGIGVRLAAEEYGATTKRPRRTGWADLEATKYAVSINGPHLIVTKVDVVQGMKKIRLGVGYRDPEGRRRGFTRDSSKLYSYTPEYEEFPGFDEDISTVTMFDGLPPGIRQGILSMERYSKGRVALISTCAETSQVIVR